jgi:hypothetical protein
MTPLGDSTRAVLAGAICLAIIGGMLVTHAWPLWTGQDVLMSATVNGAPRWTSGEYVSLKTPPERLLVGNDTPSGTSEWTRVRTLEPWVTLSAPAAIRHARGSVVYVQLEKSGGGDVTPVSVSLSPVNGALNLRGIATALTSNGLLQVEYGIDAFYMQEGHARAVERAFREKRRVQVQLAISTSGRARIRNLMIDGVPAQ